MSSPENLDNLIREGALRTMQADLEHLTLLQQAKQAKKRVLSANRQASRPKSRPKVRRSAQRSASVQVRRRRKVGPRPSVFAGKEQFLAGLAVLIILIATGYVWWSFNLTSFVKQEAELVWGKMQFLVTQLPTWKPPSSIPKPPAGGTSPELKLSPALFPVDRQMIVRFNETAIPDEFTAQFQVMAPKVQAQDGDFVRLVIVKNGQEVDLDGFLSVLGLTLPPQTKSFLTGQYTAFWFHKVHHSPSLGVVAKLKPAKQVKNFPAIIPAFRTWEPQLAGGLGLILQEDVAAQASDFKTVVANTRLLYRTQLLEGRAGFGYALAFQKGWLIMSDSSEALVKLLELLL